MEGTPKRFLKKQKSFKPKQQNMDCWLYSTSTMTANFYLRCDLEINGEESVFKDFTEERTCDMIEYKNYTTFIQHIKDIVEKFDEKEDCRSEIYYYLFFYFIYYLGITTRFDNVFIIGNYTSSFEREIMDILKNTEELGKFIGSFYDDILEERLFVNKKASDYEGEINETDSDEVKEMKMKKQTLQTILFKIYELVQNINSKKNIFVQSLDLQHFGYLFKNHEGRDIFKLTELRNILSQSYICASYANYIDPNYPLQSQYNYLCPDNTSEIISIANGAHVVVIEEVKDIEDENKFIIVIKDSNSDCHFPMSNMNINRFRFFNFVYLTEESEAVFPDFGKHVAPSAPPLGFGKRKKSHKKKRSHKKERSHKKKKSNKKERTHKKKH